jgi:biopolymer transport protein ExbD
VRFPPIRDTAVRNLVVTVNAKQEIYIGGEFIHSSKIDSVLKVKLDSLSTNHYSTTVVIIADTAAYYGKVFQIMKAAKINNAKVVVRVD